MNRENNAAIQPQEERRPQLINKAGQESEATNRDSGVVRAGVAEKIADNSHLPTETVDESDLIDVHDNVRDDELIDDTIAPAEKEAARRESAAKLYEAAQPLLEAINKQIDAHQDILAADDEQAVRIERLLVDLDDIRGARHADKALPRLDALNAGIDAHQDIVAADDEQAVRIEHLLVDLDAIRGARLADKALPRLDALNAGIDAHQDKLNTRVAGSESFDKLMEKRRAAERKREIDAIIAEAAAERAAKQRFEAVSPVLEAINAEAKDKDAREASERFVAEAPVKEFAAAIREASSPANVEKNFTAGMSDAEKAFFTEGNKAAEAPDEAGYVEKKVTTYDETGAPEKRVDQWIKTYGEAAGVVEKNELSPERRLEAAQELVALKESETALQQEMIKAQQELEKSLGMKVDEYTMQSIKSPLSSFKMGFRSLFDRDLRNRTEAYNTALEQLQSKQDEVKMLEMAINNPLEASRLAAMRIMSKLRRSAGHSPERPRILT